MNDLNLAEDGHNYEVLFNAASSIKGVPGIICEIGTRQGGSLKYIVNGLIAAGDVGRNIVCLDPYGNILYTPGDNAFCTYDYTNSMRNKSLIEIYKFIDDKNFNLVYFCLEDTEFFNRFADGVPFYDQYKTIVNQYSLVFFDGPHDTANIMNEVAFFLPRVVSGSMFVFDDVPNYDHSTVDKKLIDNGFKIVESSPLKISYVKT